MKRRSTVLIPLGCAVLCATALAQTAAVIRVPTLQDRSLARFDRLSEAQLKAYFLQCSHEATERMLALDEGALCSAAQDALKNRSFAGDFGALLAWWRVHRDDPVASGDECPAAPLPVPPNAPASGSGRTRNAAWCAP